VRNWFPNFAFFKCNLCRYVTETRNIMENAIDYAKAQGMVQEGDMVVGVHRIVGDSIMKIVECH
jgi:hypothetical protein